MKTENDTAQQHDSDCSTNNRGCPELLGPCDCSVKTLQRDAHFRNAERDEETFSEGDSKE